MRGTLRPRYAARGAPLHPFGRLHPAAPDTTRSTRVLILCTYTYVCRLKRMKFQCVCDYSTTLRRKESIVICKSGQSRLERRTDGERYTMRYAVVACLGAFRRAANRVSRQSAALRTARVDPCVGGGAGGGGDDGGGGGGYRSCSALRVAQASFSCASACAAATGLVEFVAYSYRLM